MPNLVRTHARSLLMAAGFFVAVIAGLTLLAAPPGDGPAYQTSWIGNSFSGRDGKWVQLNIASLYVAPDGACYTDSYWEEGGHEAGVYRAGDAIGALADTHGHGGYAVTGDTGSIYIAYKLDDHGAGVRRYDFQTRQPADVGPREMPGYLKLADSFTAIRGLTVVGNELFATDYARGIIHVIATARMIELRSWPIEHPERIVAAPDRTVWISQRGDGGGAVISHWTVDGVHVGRDITDVAEPTALSFDSQGRLFVADNGPKQQIRVYDHLATKPTLLGTIGENGGTFAGVRGRVGTMRFNGITGIGFDAAGNLYVSTNGIGPAFADNNGFGAELRCISPGRTLRWNLQGLEFVDTAEPDAASDTDIYTRCSHFKMDYSKPPGSQWTLVGQTIDRFRYPDDPRLHLAAECVVGVRTIKGKKLLYLTNMYSEYLLVFRFEPGSEIAIPCGMFANAHTKSGWPASQPSQGAWIWRDANGDGKIGPEECEARDGDNQFVWGWCVDQDGTVWKALREDGIRRFPMQGFDANGNPIYSYTVSELIANPRPFIATAAFRGDINRIEYDAKSDTMVLAGYTPEHPNTPSQWGQVGTVICRYDNWSKGNRVPRWEVNPPYDAGSNPPVLDKAMSVAGDYLFVTYLQQPQILVYDLNNGKYVTKLTPGPEVGNNQVGWIDVPYGISAFRRADGEYLIFSEEDARAKLLMYSWRPPAR